MTNVYLQLLLQVKEAFLCKLAVTTQMLHVSTSANDTFKDVASKSIKLLQQKTCFATLFINTPAISLTQSSRMLRYKGRFTTKQQLYKVKNSSRLINQVNRKYTEGKRVITVPKWAANEASDSKIKWNVGRRIVELGQLAKDLNGCKYCGCQISLLDTVNESRDGVGSVLHVKCDVCDTVNEVRTDTKHSDCE